MFGVGLINLRLGENVQSLTVWWSLECYSSCVAATREWIILRFEAQVEPINIGDTGTGAGDLDADYGGHGWAWELGLLERSR